MDENSGNKIYEKRIEPVLEAVGLAVALTASQLTLFHILFSEKFKANYFAFYDMVKPVDIFYESFVKLLTLIFGPSFDTALYDLVAKMFIPILLINLLYFGITKILVPKK